MNVLVPPIDAATLSQGDVVVIETYREEAGGTPPEYTRITRQLVLTEPPTPADTPPGSTLLKGRAARFLFIPGLDTITAVIRP